MLPYHLLCPLAFIFNDIHTENPLSVEKKERQSEGTKFRDSGVEQIEQAEN